MLIGEVTTNRVFFPVFLVCAWLLVAGMVGVIQAIARLLKSEVWNRTRKEFDRIYIETEARTLTVYACVACTGFIGMTVALILKLLYIIE